MILNFYQKLIARLAVALLALPSLYVASSGPIIRLASFKPTPTVSVDTTPPLKGSPRPLAARDYYRIIKVEPTPPHLGPTAADRVRDFYRPLVRTAEALHLETPLSAYLHMWGVFKITTSGDHFFFLVFNKP